MLRLTTVVTFVLASSGLAAGQTIDFETLPDGTPTVDGQTVFNQYEPVFGVTFSLLDHDTGAPIGFPVIAKVGAPGTAFGNVCSDELDTPLEGQGVGFSFLTDDGVISPGIPIDLLVTYSNPVSTASGVLIDTDCRVNGGPPCEQWTITARDAAGNTLAQVILDPPVGPANPDCPDNPQGVGDGRAISWAIGPGTGAISSVTIRSTGTTAGIAFDNFSPAAGSPPPNVTVTSTPWNKICVGESVQLAPNLTGGAAPFAYEWELEAPEGTWMPIGTNTVQTVGPIETTRYRVTVEDSQQRQATSAPFELAVCGVVEPPSCPGDVDQNGTIDLSDLAAVLAAFGSFCN